MVRSVPVLDEGPLHIVIQAMEYRLASYEGFVLDWLEAWDSRSWYIWKSSDGGFTLSLIHPSRGPAVEWCFRVWHRVAFGLVD